MLRSLSVLLILFSLLSFYLSYADTKNGEKLNTPAIESNIEKNVKENPLSNEIIVIEINGTINPATLDYIRTGLKEAEMKSAQALFILLDTPGGLLSSTKEIVKLLLNSPIPVVVYVSPSGASATSAGVFITLSANIAAMAPGTSIGAAHPVSLSPGGKQPEKKEQDPTKKTKEQNDNESAEKTNEGIMSEKIENYASSFIESIAEHRGRNVEWAIDAVRESASITATDALEMKVIDLISPSLGDLQEQINGMKVKLPQGEKTLLTSGAKIQRVEMSIKQKLID